MGLYRMVVGFRGIDSALRVMNWRRRADSNRCIEAKRLKTRSDTVCQLVLAQNWKFFWARFLRRHNLVEGECGSILASSDLSVRRTSVLTISIHDAGPVQSESKNYIKNEGEACPARMNIIWQRSVRRILFQLKV